MKYLVLAALALFGALALVGCTRKPLTPAAPWTDVVNDKLYFLTTTTDPSGLKIEYLFDWGDGQTARTTRRYESGETAYIEHSFVDPAWCEVRVQASNEKGKSSAWSPPLRFRKSNAPVIVDDTISGLVRWTVNRWYRASVQVTDPDGDSVNVKFIWDGVDGTWTAFVPSGSVVTDSCLWTTMGPHTVEAVARDKGNMVARPESAKTVNVSQLAVTWYRTSGEVCYVGTPALGSFGGEPALYCLGNESTYCYGLDGRLRWTTATSVSGCPSASLSLDGTRLYYSDDGGLVCLDSRTGIRKWSFPLDTIPYASAECTPAVGPDGSIYIAISGWYDFQLARVKDCGDSAALQWLKDLGEFGGDDVVVGRNGAVYAIEGDEYSCYCRLFALDSNGAVLWVDSTTITDAGAPVIDSHDRLVVTDDFGHLFCFNPDGTLAWSVTTSELYTGSTAIGPNDEIITTDYYGNLTVFDNSGHEQWSTPLVVGEMTTPCVADDGSLIFYDAGDAIVYDIAADGRTQWMYSIVDSLGIQDRGARKADVGYEPSPVIGPNGDLYLASDCYGLFCLSGANLHMANTAWPTYNHDVARSGWAGRP